MADLDMLFRTVDELTPDEKQRLMDYLQQSQQRPTRKLTRRVFGLHPNAMIISNDFDDELPDSFWLGEG